MSTEKLCPSCGTKCGREMISCPHDGTGLVSRGTEEDPFIGLEIDGRVRIDRYMGAGGMGHVYVGTQLDATAREVAVKFIRHELLRGAEDEKRFFREIRTLATAAHANVVSVYFSGHANVTGRQIPYFAMELLDGRPFSDIVGSGRTLAPLRAVRLSASIASGLSALHHSGIVHRDLKPANVLLLEGQEDAIKILDFGLAKPIENENETTVTVGNLIMGTPAYMSPEQMMALELDARSDLYSLGVMLYEALSGKRPPRPGAGESVPLDEACGGLSLPKSLIDLTHQLMMMDRAERPESAQIVLRRLRAIADEILLGGKPIADMETEMASDGFAETVASEPPPPSVKNLIVSQTTGYEDPDDHPTSPVPTPTPTVATELAARRANRFALMAAVFGGLSLVVVIVVVVLAVNGVFSGTQQDSAQPVAAQLSPGAGPESEVVPPTQPKQREVPIVAPAVPDVVASREDVVAVPDVRGPDEHAVEVDVGPEVVAAADVVSRPDLVPETAAPSDLVDNAPDVPSAGGAAGQDEAARQAEQQRLAAQKERKARERKERERKEWERREKERLEKERLEKERLEKEREEKERLENERLEKERLEKERKAREGKDPEDPESSILEDE